MQNTHTTLSTSEVPGSAAAGSYDPAVALQPIGDNLQLMDSSLPQIILILVGLVGSGKSTFATALQRYRPEFLRCNQDELGNRRRVEELARSQLQRGGSVCIDRTNVDAGQRSTWIRMGREFPRTSTWVLHFDTPYEICVERLRTRVGHPTISSPEQGVAVLRRFSADFQPPSPYEGYNKLLQLTATEQPAIYSPESAERVGRMGTFREGPPGAAVTIVAEDIIPVLMTITARTPVAEATEEIEATTETEATEEMEVIEDGETKDEGGIRIHMAQAARPQVPMSNGEMQAARW
ncbi:hypothetical protein NM688_g4426 [Phlebia brevispora]|uniref:Uncharacterized protein n=1 Tax=Phlebia brevispora TaxID=194682 RepID=A0ACC1T2Z6_9APHY|nr:hypothetical protein NM688_g4426 [Phlebia brevispora]